MVDENGKVLSAITKEAYKTFKGEIARVLNEMPAWQPASYNGTNVSCVLHFEVDFNIRRTEQVQVGFNETEITILKEKDDMTSATNDKNTISFNSDQLGWLCLGKYLSNNYERADVIVPDNANCLVRLLAKDRKLVASGENCMGYTRFKSMPVGARSYIVATKNENGELYYAVVPLQLRKQNIVTIPWKKGDETEIEKALAAI